MVADPESVQQLREALRQCQLELAQVRAAQETLAEEQFEAANRSNDVKAVALSRALNDRLVKQPSGGTGLRGRAWRWLSRRRMASAEEWRQVDALRASDLFRGPWYLRQYPDVAATGLPPALHYLRHGAAAGHDPGPKFSTTGYLRKHPDVAASGTNPLVHHLEQQRRGASGPRT